MIIISIFGLLLVCGILLLYFYMVTYGAPYARSQSVVVESVIAFANIKHSDQVIDIGSGDGQMVEIFAKFGCKSYGIELNPVLAWYSRRKLSNYTNITIYNADLWSHNYSKYDVVYIYGMPHLMKRLQTKLMKELKPGAKVITNAFQFPDWPEAKHEGRLHLYIQT